MNHLADFTVKQTLRRCLEPSERARAPLCTPWEPRRPPTDMCAKHKRRCEADGAGTTSSETPVSSVPATRAHALRPGRRKASSVTEVVAASTGSNAKRDSARSQTGGVTVRRSSRASGQSSGPSTAEPMSTPAEDTPAAVEASKRTRSQARQANSIVSDAVEHGRSKRAAAPQVCDDM